MIVYYDGHCKICRNIRSFWEKVDIFNNLELVSFRDIENYDPEMEKQIHVQYKGRTYKGYNAIVMITKKLPVLWGGMPILFLFKTLGLGDKLYDYVANNRKMIPVNHCKEDTCSITHDQK